MQSRDRGCRKGLPAGRESWMRVHPPLCRWENFVLIMYLISTMLFRLSTYSASLLSWALKIGQWARQKKSLFSWSFHQCKETHQRIWCLWTVVLEKTLQSPLDCKEIQPVHPKGNQSWIFIEGTDAEDETPILNVMWRTHSFEKTLMLGKIEGRRRRG